MKIHLATDHAGLDLKNSIKNYLLQKEYFDMKETGYGGSYADFLRSKIRVTKANGGLISNYKIESRKP